nr:BMC domain-containing protein [uncultured Photobacterium sp.]
MTISLGVIETIGLTSAIHAADAACKAAGVQLTSYRKVGSGLVSIYLQGEISAVKAAVDSGLEALAQQASQATSTVMARPDPSVLAMLENGALDKGNPNDGGQDQGSTGPGDVPPEPSTPAAEVLPKKESGSPEDESSAQADSSISPESTVAPEQMVAPESTADNQRSAERKAVTEDASPEGAKPAKTAARRQSAARREKSTNSTSTRGSKQ